MICSYFEIDL